MFTGIIEEVGYVRSITRGAHSARITINAHTVCQGTRVGDSIAVNGVCLTVTEISPSFFTADIMAETLLRTTLGKLQCGDAVNLERALTLARRLGGHLVSGHVDGSGTIHSILKEGIASILEITCSPELLKYIATKGSIALDGISLTICSVSDSGFSVSLIPHTQMQTNAYLKKVGDTLNIECDLIARYVEKLIMYRIPDEAENTLPVLTEELLRLSGFIGGK